MGLNKTFFQVSQVYTTEPFLSVNFKIIITSLFFVIPVNLLSYFHLTSCCKWTAMRSTQVAKDKPGRVADKPGSNKTRREVTRTSLLPGGGA